MKNHSLMLFFLLLLEVVPIKAQTVEWGNQQKTKAKYNYTQVLGENASGIFLARARNSDFRRDIQIEKYKNNLALEFAKDLPQPENAWVERVIVHEDGLFQLNTLKNIPGKVEIQLQLIDNNINLVSTKTLISMEGSLSPDKRIFIRSSSDKKNYTILFVTQGSDKNKSILNIFGFDPTFGAKYTRRFALDYAAEDVFVSHMECDNEGNAFALIDFPKEGRKPRDYRPRNYFLYAYLTTKDNMLEFAINKDSVFVNELSLVVNNYAKTVNVAGFYSDKSDNKSLGTIYFKLNSALAEMTVKRFDQIDLSFSSKIAGTMQNERKPILTDLYVRRLIPNSDGGCTIIAEKYYETKQSYTYNLNGFPQTSYKTVYNYDEIVIIAKNADGSERFRHFIKKTQSSMNDGGYYSSFLTTLSNDKIGIVYNVDVVNEGDVMLATIASNGEVESKVLIKSMSYFVTIMPPESRQVSARSIVIPTSKDHRFCLMRLNF
jgi:hypothetical protein